MKTLTVSELIIELQKVETKFRGDTTTEVVVISTIADEKQNGKPKCILFFPFRETTLKS